MRPVRKHHQRNPEGLEMTATRFAPVTNIFTGEEVIRFVPIPQVSTKRKGETQHDAKFTTLLDFKQALLVPEHEFGGMRKALQRFLDNRNLRASVTMRQRKDHRTKSYTIWLADEPPQVHIKRKSDEKA
jgi:hypothetical protein